MFYSRKFLFASLLTLLAVGSISSQTYAQMSFKGSSPKVSEGNVGLNGDILSRADQFWSEKSFQQATQLYKQFLDQNLSKEIQREVMFKFADASWRTKDQRQYEEAIKILKELMDSDEHDQWWAEASESLAEYYLQVDRWSNREQIKKGYENAREFWAGSKNIDLARRRFIDVTFAFGKFITEYNGWYASDIKPTSLFSEKIPDGSGQGGLYILYEEVLKVAKSDEDKAQAYYSLAMSFMNYQQNEKDIKKVVEYFEKVMNDFSNSEWADDAYYHLGQFFQNKQDFRKAVEIFQEFTTRYRKGESRWWDDAKNQIKYITQSQISLNNGFAYLPGSEIQFSMNWRNVSSANCAIYKLDLTQQLVLDPNRTETDSRRGIGNYENMIAWIVKNRQYQQLPKVLSWQLTLENKGEHQYYNANKGLAEWIRQDEKEDIDPKMGVLAPGAYLLLVQAGGKTVYDLILVTDMAIATKTGGHSAVVYAFDSFTGKPKANTSIKYHYRYYNNSGNRIWEEGEGITNEKGLFTARLKVASNRNYNNQHELFVTAVNGEMQAFSTGNYYNYVNGGEQWKLYAYSDRPAYRPNEEVSFKATLRNQGEEGFQTPGEKVVTARINDARGNKVFEKKFILNEFGSLSDVLTLDEKATLGEYYLQILAADGNHLAQVTLFRLEEYKLPEFLVTVKPLPKEGEKVTTYQLGDKVQVEVDAQYYFGGPVAEADVEYLVYQENYNHYYSSPRKYPWFYENIYQRNNNYYGGGQLVKKESIKTDKEGKASFEIETPENIGTDLKYRIEVRIVDQSRREITSTSEIKVTQNAFYAYLTPKQNLYRPGDKASVDIKTMTANNEPVAVEAKVSVSRNWWRGDVLQKGGVVASNVYEENELFTRFVKTDKKGEAKFEFEPQEDGYYIVKFTGFDNKGNEITSQTNVFVCDQQSKDIGYRYGAIQIIAEKDTYDAGETARVMMVADNPDSWLLFSIEADEIFEADVEHLEGTVKVVEFKVTEAFLPNVYLNVLSAENHQVKMNNLQLIIPPEEKYLNVKILSDKENYKPQEKGIFDVEVTDKNGEPVAGEVSLGVVDSSVYYIQSEYVQDIRQFFYGQKRPLSVQTQTSYQQRRYQKLVRSDDGQLMTEEMLKQRKFNKDKNDVTTVTGQENWDSYRGMVADGMMMKKGESLALGMVSDEMASPQMTMKSVGGRRMAESKEMAFADADMEMTAPSSMPNEANLQKPTVRQDFRSTAFWQPMIVTDENGKAHVEVTFPDSLTTWKATARAITVDTSVGNITQETKTQKDVMVRLQAPRFFTERDQVVLSANVHNYTKTEQKIKVSIQAEGLTIKGEKEVWVTVESMGEKRVDFSALAEKQGEALISVMAQSTEDSDAMKKTYPIIPHGIEKFIAGSAALKVSDGRELSKNFILDLPKERSKESTSLRLVMSPSLAGALIDALPYLAQYPYGCVEQTMSRFLPAVVVKKTMKELGLSESQINGYLSDVLNPRNDPKYPEQGANTLAKLDQMVKAGMDRLIDFQHADGGWGWWKEGNSDRFMTAYVVWGISEARRAGLDISQNVTNRAAKFLREELVEEENNPDMLAWMLHALSGVGSNSTFEDKQIEHLWEVREELNPYTRALFALSQYYRGDKERAQVLARNLANGIQEDADNGTLYWGEAGIHYRWSEGGVEATAFCIKALSNIMPDSELLDPAVKWMALNRRGSRWKNTRDTAIAILGLADYLKTTNELNPDLEYSVMVNGKAAQSGHIDSANVFQFNRMINLPDEVLKNGENTVEVKINGKGSLYVSGYLKYFTLEENITPAGNEVFVERKYFINDTAETLLKGYEVDWRPLKSGDTIKSGARIKVEVTLEAKNNYEYLVSEDYKPAGFEAVSLTSGSGYAVQLDYKGNETNQRTWVYQEFRDQKVAVFIDKLKQGKHRLSYELRAEVPGTFHAMPNQTHAMYVPEIRANSAEMILSVEDK